MVKISNSSYGYKNILEQTFCFVHLVCSQEINQPPNQFPNFIKKIVRNCTDLLAFRASKRQGRIMRYRDPIVLVLIL